MQTPQSNSPQYDDPKIVGPVIVSRHQEGYTTAIDIGVIWYATDAACFCADANMRRPDTKYHYRSLYDGAKAAE